MRHLLAAFLVIVSAGSAQSWDYATYLGWATDETAVAIGSDAAGNTYIASNWRNNGGLPASAHPSPASTAVGAFLIKLDPQGKKVYTRFHDDVLLIAARYDGQGYLYASGSFPGPHIFKFDSDGNLVFRRLLPMALGSFNAITPDGQGNMIGCGRSSVAAVRREFGEAVTVAAGVSSDRAYPYCVKFSGDSGVLVSGIFLWSIPDALVRAVATDSEGGLLVAGTESPVASLKPRTLFRRSPGESQWQAAGNPVNAGISTVQFIGGQMFLQTTAGLYSGNADASSIQVVSPDRYRAVVHPLNARYICSVTTVSTFCSDNGGVSYRNVSSSSLHVVPDPFREGEFYFLSIISQPLSRYSVKDWGFVEMIPTAPSSRYTSVAVQQTALGRTEWTVVNNRTLYKSVGVTPPSPSLAPPVLENVYAVFAHPNDGSVYAIRTDAASARFARSDDGGSTWIDLAPGFVPRLGGVEFLANGLTFDPTDPEHLMLATPDGLYQSNDRGATWNLFMEGLTNLAIFSVSFDPSGNMWASAALPPRSFLTRIHFSENPTATLYSTLDGSGGAEAQSVRATSDGRILIAGRTESTDLDGLAGEPLLGVKRPPRGQSFLASFAPDGTLEWSRILASSAWLLAPDKAGRIPLAGDEVVHMVERDGSAVLSSMPVWGAVAAAEVGQDNRLRVISTAREAAIATSADAIQAENAGGTDVFVLISTIGPPSGLEGAVNERR